MASARGQVAGSIVGSDGVALQVKNPKEIAINSVQIQIRRHQTVPAGEARPVVEAHGEPGTGG